jgi:hypothetical protein
MRSIGAQVCVLLWRSGHRRFLALTLYPHHLHLTICAPPCELSIRPALPTDLTLTRSPFLAGPAGGCGWHARC